MVGGVSRRGATKVEYALTLMLVSLSCIVVVGALGENVGGLYDKLLPPGGTVPQGRTDDPPPPPPPDEKGKDKDKDKGGHGNNGRHGNPGNGNNGNDKDAGNAH